MLAERMAKHNVDCWLVNTGWTGGKYGTGKRCPLKYTRKIIDAIHDGSLAATLAAGKSENFGVFNLTVPTEIEDVPRELLNPEVAWADKEAFGREVRKLAVMFGKAFKLYESDVDDKVRKAGPNA
jgi:phosphoenolpyruvate carboxykinase (ATP)